MFVALILTVCSISDAKDCRTEELLFESHGSLRNCMFEAVPYIASWTETHPKWKVARWKCGMPGGAETPI